MTMNPRLLRPRRRVTVPGAPTITVAVEATSLEWLPPVSNGGSPILFYRVYLVVVTARPVRVQAAADIAVTTPFYVPRSFKRLG